jgi:hypothetical protein
MCPGANQEPTHGRLGSVEAKAVRPTSGVGWPHGGPPALCFLLVAVRWILQVVPDPHAVLRQFGHIGGP